MSRALDANELGHIFEILAKNELLTSGRYGHCAHAKLVQLFLPSSVVQDIDGAQEKGLLKKSGLEAEYIQMNTGIQPQAIIAGNINFFSLSIDWDLRRGGRFAARCRTQLLRDYAVDARDHERN